ncbi:MAG: hypothetical protein AB7F09_13300 [Parvibaculaceae bacterium]
MMPRLRLALALSVLTALFLIGAGLAPQARAQAIDWKRYCAADGRDVLLFLDVTTPYDAQDKTILVDGLQRIVADLKGGERIVIRTIGDSAAHSERLIDRCIPFCPPKGFWEDLLSDCTGGLILNHKRILIAEIRKTARERLDNFRELEFSDIVTTIALVSREELTAEKTAEMFLFSDLIENSSFMPGGEFLMLPNEALLQRVAENRLVPELRGAKVHVFGVGRGGTAERAALPIERLNKIMEFWTRLFTEGGSASVSINQNLAVQ